MPRPAVDVTGTLKEAQARGVSRRTVQRERARLREQTTAAVEQAKPVQLVLDGFEPTRLPALPVERIDPLEAAARAGWLERATYHRLEEALQRGDAAGTKLFSSALSDVYRILEKVEPLAEQRVRDLRDRLRDRLDIARDFENTLATHGAAFVNAHAPSHSERQPVDGPPLTEEECLRWNEYRIRQDREDRRLQRQKERQAAAAPPPAEPGPCERELRQLPD